jgi:ABC-type nitrate/sulfonate/bicarbonate transport system permease component
VPSDHEDFYKTRDTTRAAAETAISSLGLGRTTDRIAKRLGLSVPGRLLGRNRGTLVVVIVFLALVEFASLFLPPYLFPDVVAIFSALYTILTTDLSDISITIARFGVALVLAIAVGWSIGLFMGAFRTAVGQFMLPALNIIQAVPALSWILVSVLWISSVEIRIILICFIIGMPFFALNVYEGLRDIDGDLVKAINQFRPTRLQIIRILLIPQSFVYLLLSVRSAASLCLRILVFAEMIGATSGVGERMAHALANFRMDQIFAWTVILIFVGFGVSRVSAAAEWWLLSWREEAVVR